MRSKFHTLSVSKALRTCSKKPKCCLASVGGKSNTIYHIDSLFIAQPKSAALTVVINTVNLSCSSFAATCTMSL